MTVGEIVPAGENLLIVIEIFGLLVEMNQTRIFVFLNSKNFFSIICEVFEKHPWNSFLHNTFLNFVTCALKPLSRDFIIQQLAELVIKYCLKEKSCLGLVGHCWKVAYLLIEISDNDEDFKQKLNSIESWDSEQLRQNYHLVFIGQDV